MSSSLDSLVKNLARGNKKFFGFEDYNKSQHKLLIQKRIYPYEYMDDWNRFKETILPPKEAFYSKLNMSGVSLVSKIWENTTTYIYAQTLSY